MKPTSLTEFDHAVSAWFDNVRLDPAQQAWFDRTVYWTAWRGILCDQDCFWSEDMEDEWWFDDDTARCEGQSETSAGVEATIDEANALWDDGANVEDRLDSADERTTWPLLHMRRWASLGRMWRNEAAFVQDRKHRYRVKCDQ